MTDIFITGSSDDKKHEQLIKSRLVKSYTITYINHNSFYKTGSGYNLIVFESEYPQINTNGSILLMKKNGVIPASLPADITAIINADNEEQLKSVQRHGIKAITCGACDTSTVSFSSETDETIVISLNRSITALSGKNIQPLEIPAEKGGADRYSLMSYMALRLILDDYNSDLGRLI